MSLRAKRSNLNPKKVGFSTAPLSPIFFRYYDPLNGRFNQMDPYAGSPQDPQSLHKYLYCHANPMNAIDPSGRFTLGEVVIGLALVAVLIGIVALGIRGCTSADWKIKAGQPPLKIAVVCSSDASRLFAGASVNVNSLVRQLREGGHTVDLVMNPDEDGFAGVLMDASYNIMLVVAHGAGGIASQGNVEELLDKNGQPFAAFILGGDDDNAADGEISDNFCTYANYSGTRKALITANEVAQRVPRGAANANLEVAAAACSQGNSSRWFDVIHSRVFVGFKVPVTPPVAAEAMRYVANRASGLTIPVARQEFISSTPGQGAFYGGETPQQPLQ